jgi:hypothetical protein
VRSSSNFTYWLADHAIVFLLKSGHVLDAADANFVDTGRLVQAARIAAPTLENIRSSTRFSEGFLYRLVTDFCVADCRLADGLPCIADEVEEFDETFVGLAVRSLAVARHQEKLTALTPPGS